MSLSVHLPMEDDLHRTDRQTGQPEVSSASKRREEPSRAPAFRPLLSSSAAGLARVNSTLTPPNNTGISVSYPGWWSSPVSVAVCLVKVIRSPADCFKQKCDCLNGEILFVRKSLRLSFWQFYGFANDASLIKEAVVFDYATPMTAESVNLAGLCEHHKQMYCSMSAKLLHSGLAVGLVIEWHMHACVWAGCFRTEIVAR